MQILTKKNNVIVFRDNKYNYLSCEKLDDNTIHINMENEITFCFLADDTELNGVTYKNSDELLLAISE